MSVLVSSGKRRGADLVPWLRRVRSVMSPHSAASILPPFRLSAFPPFRLSAFLLLALSSPALAQTRDWSLRDRTVIGDFTRITAVAASIDRVFAATPTALLIYRPQFRQWEGPYFPRDPSVLDRISAALVDPLDNSVWLAGQDGWLHFNPDVQLWEQGTAPGAIREIAFDQDQPVAGLFLNTTAGWFSIPRGGFSPVAARPPRRALRPLTINEAIRLNPSLQANSSAILMTAGLRQVRFTAAARGFGGRGLFVGTSGAGLLSFADGAALPDRLTFGLPGGDVGAVTSVPGGVWAATQRGSTQDAALSMVANDLSSVRWIQGPKATGLPFAQVRKLIASGRWLWAATEGGVVRIDPASEITEVFDDGRGLPDRRTFDLAARRGQIAVATAHGIAVINDSGVAQRVAPGFSDAATAIEWDNDTIWVGTQAGLFAALPGEQALLKPETLLTSAAFSTTIEDLAWLGDTLVALTQDRLLWRNPTSRVWTLGPPLSAQLGRMRALLPYRNGFFVGGQRGFGYVRLLTGVARPFLTPGDLPGEVTDLAAGEPYLWVATRNGLVRWQLDAVGP